MPWTIEEARESLRTWLEAERAVATGAEYTIGTRRLKRADLAEIASRINFWRAEIAALESRRGVRVWRGVPRDF